MFYNDCYGYGYPTVINTGGGYGNGGAWGSDGIWAILLLALLGGFGGRGYGAGGYGAGSEFLGYELGKTATTNDVASGFSTSTILGTQREIQLAQTQGFADIRNALCEGFSTTNIALERGLGTTNFNMAQGFNGISSQIAQCCCDLKALGMENRYLNEKQTCDLLVNQNQNTQRIIDWLNNKELCDVKAENLALKGQISNFHQTNAIVGSLNPTPIPAYSVPNPNCCYNNYGFNSGCIGIQ